MIHCMLASSSCFQHSPGGSMVSVSDSSTSGSEFETWLRQNFFPAYFRLSPLLKHERKVVGGFGKKSCVSISVRKPGNTCVTDRHDMTLAVKVALNPNTINHHPVSSIISVVPKQKLNNNTCLSLYFF